MRRSVLVVALAVLGLAPACAVGPEDEAHVIEREAVPYALLADEYAEATSTIPDGATVAMFLVRDGQLVEVERRLPSDAERVDLLRLLAAGPSEQEAAAGLSTAVPDPDVFRDVEVVRGTAEVDLDPSFSELDGDAQALAIAQTVFTLTARPGVGRVGFSLDEASAEVPRGDGTLTDNALAREDFPDALAPDG